MSNNNSPAPSLIKRAKFNFERGLMNLSRPTKRFILIVADAIILAASLWFAMVLRYGFLDFPKGERLDGLYFLLPIAGLLVYWYLGLYKSMLRSMEGQTIQIIVFGAFIMALIIAAFTLFDPETILPRSVPLIYGMLVIVGVGSVRFILKAIYQTLATNSKTANRIVIYGAGIIGTQLAAMLQNAPEYSLVGFLDDDPSLWGSRIRGKTIYSLASLTKMKDKGQFDQIFLAINNISPSDQRATIQSLSALNVPIKTMPRLANLMEDGEEIRGFKQLKIQDLLGRQVVNPIEGLIESGLSGKSILVTGAAGSIGSEICRLILSAKPSTLIAYDSSELGLYKLEQELRELTNLSGINFQIKLGSILNRGSLDRIISESGVELIYHAAAYKHVPIVEDNIIAAVRNNVHGTQTVAQAAIDGKVERFILISTDKAVRPTNIMGATKRLAELIVQDLQAHSKDTILSMVRFGNVLGSSGSVIPLFEKQIKNGGPVTLTHKDVTRYFMTIHEAAQLVLQAGFLAKGGEVFLLDMGKPVKLKELAVLMIQLSGNRVKTESSDPTAIEIKEIGLRPGEKLYEELLIGKNAQGTRHAKIMQAEEDVFTKKQMQKLNSVLNPAVKNNDESAIILLLEQYASLSRTNDNDGCKD